MLYRTDSQPFYLMTGGLAHIAGHGAPTRSAGLRAAALALQ